MSTEPPVAKGVAPRPSVLVVDDNRDLCDNLREILEGRGYATRTALSVRGGVAALEEGLSPDVALVDLNLPDGRGTDFIAELRRRSPATAAVILTGNATLATAVEAVNHGAYAYLLKGGRVEEVIATIDRAAEKVRLERELEVQRSFSRAVLASASLGILVVGAAGEVVDANAHMLRLAGTAPLRDRADLLALAADEPSRERLAASLRGATDPFEVLVAGGRAGGSRTWRVSTSMMQGGGHPEGAVVAAIIDVTSEKDLQRRVIEGSRLAAIGEMAARVAHEIRNPLAGIGGAIRVLSRGSVDPEKRETFSREVLALIGRLNGFVEDLLLYARPLHFTKADVTLAEVVAPMRSVLAEHPLVRGVDMVVDDRAGGPIHGERHLLCMALQNLVVNGAQAMKGAGRIAIEAEREPGGGVRIVVSDEGPGIAPELLPRLFHAFATTRVEGTGLGLSTAKRVIEAHGGTIAAENRPEGGARFVIRLPA